MAAAAATAIVTASCVIYADPITLSDYKGHWAYDSIAHLYSIGVIRDWPGGVLSVDKPATRAEVVTLINKIFNFTEKAKDPFKDVSESSWYANEVAKAKAAGYIQGDDSGNFRPNDPISRQEAAVIITRVFKLVASNNNAVDKFSDVTSIADWSKSSVAAMVERGYISGRDGGRFAPNENITCAETLKLIDNMFEELASKADTYVGNIKDNLIVNTGDVVLKDMVINGNLYLSEGIGDGVVRLENVVVKGKTFIAGGGEAGITINNSTLEGPLNVNKKNGKITLIAKGSTNISQAELSSGGKIQEDHLKERGFDNITITSAVKDLPVSLDGEFGVVTTNVAESNIELIGGSAASLVVAENAKDSKIKVAGGTVSEMSIKSANTEVNLTGGTVTKLGITTGSSATKVSVADQATIKSLVADAGANVTGKGKIEAATVNSNNVVIEQKPTTVTIATNITTSIGGASNNTTGSTGTVTNSGSPTAVRGGSPGTPSSGGSTPPPGSMPAMSSFSATPGLLLGFKTVIVELNTTTPGNYKVFVGSTELQPHSSTNKFYSTDVPEAQAYESNVRIMLR